ncbi:copper amine oxidase N-terminal domain-containing protein [Paenibacillus sp. sptzw28]|uniref:copper amine oxidase N-terminal domain-containing protein n=1 Tax=Paenibacillus sp. sptzw28 TaxID=715179 RepID=UPI001C6EF68C|nr:copper amine oxidase N-terminal domain-containing protein [Paenibacillus sp. sptzw28]QYR20779.1 copper amine oxidase N-terminal domain-containing protein [Paenibacillus sp. sptzw28]
MKKKVIFTSIIATLMLMSAGVGAYAAAKLTLIVNGQVAKVEPKVIDGTTYVPLRAAAELLGAKVGYDASTRTVSITSAGSTPTPTPANPAKSYSVNVKMTSGPMNLTISKVTLDPAYKADEYSKPVKAVVLDTVAENTSDDTVSWYPDQGEIVTNTKEQINAAVFLSDDVGGDFKGKVIKKGKIVFEVSGDIDAITSFNYFVSGAIGGSFERIGEDAKTEIILQ